MLGGDHGELWANGLPEQTTFEVSEADKFGGFFDSDFYCERDDVTRSAMSHDFATPGGAVPLWSTDFVSSKSGFGFQPDLLEEDTVRGVTLAPGAAAEPLWASGFDSAKGSPFLYCDEATYSFGGALSSAQEPDGLPPMVPGSRHFHLEPTTLVFEDSLPQEIWSSLMNFFVSQVVSELEKVRTLKYSIKAQVFVEGIACTLKVRVYNKSVGSDGLRQYAVEFQRRSGNSFAFASLYRLAADFLKSQFTCIRGPPDWTPLPVVPPPPAEKTESTLAEVAPLLDMASNIGVPQQQAEASTALCELARGEDGAVEPLLQNPEAAGAAFLHLLSSASLEIAYPAARALHALADNKEAAQLLAAPGLLQAMVHQAGVQNEAQGSARNMFAQATVTCVRRCAAELTVAAKTELQTQLSEVLADPYTSMEHHAVSRGYLDEALREIYAL